MGYTRTYTGMWLASLTDEQRARTCGYWYTVTTYGSTPHTAFRTKAALQRWLELTGLSVAGDIPEHGVWGSFRLNGSYRAEAHLYDADKFDAIEGIRTRELSNGDYVEAVYSTDPYDGLRTVHTLNPNVEGRKVFDYWLSDEMHSAGEL
jgi:hypothetical protein